MWLLAPLDIVGEVGEGCPPHSEEDAEFSAGRLGYLSLTFLRARP